ncbi:hypothetical protein BJX99DRAFT_261143 [Aspergillus californicus]
MSSGESALTDVVLPQQIHEAIDEFLNTRAEKNLRLKLGYRVLFSRELAEYLDGRKVTWYRYDLETLVVKARTPVHDALTKFANDSYEHWAEYMPQNLLEHLSLDSNQRRDKRRERQNEAMSPEMISDAAFVLKDPQTGECFSTVVFLAALSQNSSELDRMGSWFLRNEARVVITAHVFEDRRQLEYTKDLLESKKRIISLLTKFGNDRTIELRQDMMRELPPSEIEPVAYSPIPQGDTQLEQEMFTQIKAEVQIQDWVGPLNPRIFVSKGTHDCIADHGAFWDYTLYPGDLIPYRLHGHFPDFDKTHGLKLNAADCDAMLRDTSIELAARRATAFLRPPP